MSSVSVALCTRNSSRFIIDQIESILDQTSPPAELVVSDDASTDQTVDIVENLMAQRGAHVSLIVLRNPVAIGVTANFEQAAMACTSDLIALSDHDDVWHPQRIEGDLERFEADPTLLLLHSNAALIDEAGRPLHHDLFHSLSIRPSELQDIARGRAFEVYLRRNLVTGAATMFRRTLLHDAAPFPQEWVHDEWLGIIAAARDGARLSVRTVIDYRQHTGNVIGVRAPTLRNRLARFSEPRASRYVRLAARALTLVDRIEQLPVRDEWRALARRKLGFERVRAAYPTRRSSRLVPILRAWARGDYHLLSSQRSADVLRDLVQPS